MTKFLQISGIVFWLQVSGLSVYGFYSWFQFNQLENEVNAFAQDFTQEILSNRDYDQYSTFFDSSFDESNFLVLSKSLEKLGTHQSCKYQSSVELPGPASTISGNCIFQNSEAELYIELSKNQTSWLINIIRITSGIFEIAL